MAKFCSNCGNELNGVKFCPNCGAIVEEIARSSAVAEQEIETIT